MRATVASLCGLLVGCSVLQGEPPKAPGLAAAYDQYGEPAVNAAQQLCGAFHSERQRISLEDAIGTACDTVAAIGPWLPLVADAMRTGNARALERE